MSHEFQIEGKSHTLSLDKKQGGFTCRVNEKSLEVDIRRIGPHELSILSEGRSYRVMLASDGKNRHAAVEGRILMIREPDESGASFNGQQTGETQLVIRAPMPGKVIKIDVAAGDPVRRNQTLAVVEAMKMENEIKSTIDGSVKSISAAPGDLVDADSILIELIPEGDGPKGSEKAG